MATRTVTGTLKNIEGEPHVSARVRFQLAPFGLDEGGTAYPREEQVAVTDESGDFSIDLWVSEDSSKEAIYTCVLPTGERFRFILPKGTPVPTGNMIVSGAGTEVVNGLYLRDGDFDGKPFFEKGDPAPAIAWFNLNPPSFVIMSDEDPVYHSDEDVDTPDLVQNWSVLPAGTAPPPTVTAETAIPSIDIEELYSEYSPVEGSQQSPYIKEILSRTEEIISRVPLLDENGNLPAIVLHRIGTAAEIDALVLGNGEIALVTDAEGNVLEARAGDGVTMGGVTFIGGLASTDSSVYAKPGDDLVAKYAEAKALTPGGNALSRTNRATFTILPGSYTISEDFEIDTNFVDVIGIGSSARKPSVHLFGGRVIVTAWDVTVKGIHSHHSGNGGSFQVGARPPQTGVTGTASNNRITVANNALNVGDYIWFTALTGGTGLNTYTRYFVGVVTDSYFILRDRWNKTNITFSSNITDGEYFVVSNRSQRIVNCAADYSSGGSFTGESDTVLGDSTYAHYIDCISYSAANAFGGIDADGIYEGCRVISENPQDMAGFGANGDARGDFFDCLTTGIGFGNGEFGGASGLFVRCTAAGGFGTGEEGTLTGKLFYCRLTSGTFQTVSGGGITRYCIDGNDAANNQG